MFETATLSYGSSTKRTFATLMGFTGQALVVACAFLAPMVAPQALPRVAWITSIAPPSPPAPPLPPGPRVAPRSSQPATQVAGNTITIPTYIPDRPAILVDEPPELASAGGGVAGGVEGGQKNGVTGAVAQTFFDAASRILPTPPPPQPVTHTAPVPTVTRPPRITSLRMATPIRKVEPIDPSLARAAHVSGAVELLGVLGTDGRIHSLTVLHGHPLLIRAALEAVSQWIFEPTLLNGQPVEVAAPITVNFILQ